MAASLLGLIHGARVLGNQLGGPWMLEAHRMEGQRLPRAVGCSGEAADAVASSCATALRSSRDAPVYASAASKRVRLLSRSSTAPHPGNILSTSTVACEAQSTKGSARGVHGFACPRADVSLGAVHIGRTFRISASASVISVSVKPPGLTMSKSACKNDEGTPIPAARRCTSAISYRRITSRLS